jgi:hypothetical protein
MEEEEYLKNPRNNSQKLGTHEDIAQIAIPIENEQFLTLSGPYSFSLCQILFKSILDSSL